MATVDIFLCDSKGNEAGPVGRAEVKVTGKLANITVSKWLLNASSHSTLLAKGKFVRVSENGKLKQMFKVTSVKGDVIVCEPAVTMSRSRT